MAVMRTVLSIGDFSRMTHLSIKTLRHYHQVGLLAPAEVNPDTSYRYYTTDQVPAAQVIRRFRDLGMPVDEVRAVLEAPDPAARGELITAHLDRLEGQLAQTQAAVASLRGLLEQPDPPIAIEHRSVPASLAVAVSETVMAADLGPWWAGALAELGAVLRRQQVPASGPPGGLYDTELFAEERGGATVFIPVTTPPAAQGRVQVITIPAAELAVATHRGPHGDADRTYGALGRYVTEHALSIDGPVRESYLVAAGDTADESKWVTEIGWPVFRTAGT
jgi:DNA-binding transcriptional MerR regulator/effector-binding domain-containing protein